VLPLNGFSDDWNDGSGAQIKTCAENKVYCPNQKTLEDVGTISIWGEGVAGKVHLAVQSIAAINCGTPNPPGPAPAGKTIVQLAEATPDLSTLVTALTAGNLTGALSGAGPFSVLAPTNEAFAKVPANELKYLLEPEHIKELDAVLEYHVVAGAAVFSKDLKHRQFVKSLEGSELLVEKVTSGVYINREYKVTTADVAASNGVVHIIDGVLIPHHSDTVSAEKTIVQLAEATPELSTLVTALKAGKLTHTLSEAGPFTVFAPTNEAFSKVPTDELKRLLDPKNIKELDAVLTYHVLAGEVDSKDLSDHEKAKTLEGKEVLIRLRGSHIYVNDAEVLTADIKASNGVVHIVDGVLVPN